jgi:TRAP transporter 4TM/12TM fusion protein
MSGTPEERPAQMLLASPAGKIGAVIAAALSLHAIFIAYFGQYAPPEYIRAGAMFASVVVVVMTSPLARHVTPTAGKSLCWVIDLALIANMGCACWNFLHKLEDIQFLIVNYSTLDLASSLLAILTLLELSRRVFGLALSVFAGLTLLYCLFGQDLPWVFRHSGFSLEQAMETIWFGFQGVFGFPTGLVVLLVFIFVVFGALLEGSGAGNVMIRMALAATGRTRGGPAHAAIISSSIFGMSSGSVTANVVGTGAITIPLIRRRGFPGAFAGGVEAAASTGGQIMPPVMGAAAFLMSQLTSVPYQQICLAALLPALLYYGSLFLSVDYEARRLGLEPTPRQDRMQLEPGDGPLSLMFFLPLLAIITTLAMGRSASMAGFAAVVVTLATALILNPAIRKNPQRLLVALTKGGIAGAHIMMAVGAIGLIIGVFDLTGLGLKFASEISLIAQDDLFLALVFSALACLVLGMGMPTLPAYLVIVLVMGVTLKKIGIPELSVHMFVFYFGVLSAITPPIALAAVAAAPIAQAEPIRTGITALRLAAVGFVVPFVFVYEPSLLLVVEGFSWPALISVLVRLIFAIWLLTTALSGYDTARLGALARGLRIVAAAALLTTIPQAQIAGICLAVGLVALDRLSTKRKPTQTAIGPNS